LAASCHGSTSSRASAESTLSAIPFRSSPIGANKKVSNSEFRTNEVVADAMGAIGFLGLGDVRGVGFAYLPADPSVRALKACVEGVVVVGL